MCGGANVSRGVACGGAYCAPTERKTYASPHRISRAVQTAAFSGWRGTARAAQLEVAHEQLASIAPGMLLAASKWNDSLGPTKLLQQCEAFFGVGTFRP